MKKRIFSAALCLLLLLSCGPLAFADVIYPAPGDVEAGSPLEHLAATVAPESSVSAAESTLPDGVNVETDDGSDGLDIYLRGTPDVAGYYNCFITITGESVETAASAISIPVHVTAAMPELQVSDDVVCEKGDSVELSVTAYVGDGAQLSYQWYASADGGTNISIFIDGADQATFRPGTDTPGVYRYYCVVTNSNNGETTEAVSPVITVTVEDNTPQVLLTGIALETPPTKLVYSVGDDLDTAGMRIRASYSDGSVVFLDSGFTVSPQQLNQTGDQEIVVSYEGYSCSSYATVEAQEVVTGIEILSLPSKVNYKVGEYLDTAGMSIRATTSKGFRDVSSGFQCNPSLLDSAGTKTIAVYYEGCRCDFTVQVAEAEQERVIGLSVRQLPTKTNYLVGENLDVSGLVLQQTTNLGKTEDIYYGFTVSPNRLERSGPQQITVNYNGLSCSFQVNVSQPQASPSPTVFPSPTPTAFPSPSPSVQPSPSPVVSPSPTPQSNTATRQASMAKTLVIVIICSAVLALGVLGAYLYIANRGGFEDIADQLRDLFRRRK